MTTDTPELSDPPPGYKYMPCRHCGEPMLVRSIRKSSPGHVECGVQAHAEYVRQLLAKEGPHYDHWLTGQALALERARGGGTPHAPDGDT